MPRIFKLPEAATLAFHAVMNLVDSRERPVPVHELAEDIAASEAHLAKVMQRLAHAGIVKSVRGPGGGFALNGNCGETTLMDVYEAVEGPIEAAPCLFDSPVCGRRNCAFGGVFEDIDRRLREFLSQAKICEEPD